MKWVLVLLACLAVAMACGLSACKSGSKDGGTASNQITGEWTLTEIDGAAVKSMLVEGMKSPTMSIAADGKAGGFAGVNQWSATLLAMTPPTGKFELTPIMSTKMAGPREAMSVESRYLSHLGAATAYEIRGKTLTLKKGSDSILTFERAE